MYHTTKIWEFSFRCHLCPERIVVRTDPENTEYEFVSGAYKIVFISDIDKLICDFQLSTENATDVEFMRSEEEVDI